eukprot:762653-Hanusia_phi.AAC.1
MTGSQVRRAVTVRYVQGWRNFARDPGGLAVGKGVGGDFCQNWTITGPPPPPAGHEYSKINTL